mmetsp:Transcript_124904/g.249405  ORF Transcript_124904/g.249405 Transcript_124904/m.249405 type:complete len:198 (-) Transcript_124904:240-833(-)|eukprot:CAMPEP_0172675544 /NCGR_PEP_ID=MMETSP1074-20121228/13328_1 /TAXON_ID=2916 /ORGANISM="Ceratium fusus, Strain PA161109" /LENGTH=197 /DNA_ID=CAMNT_0013493015 /DNA_START=51 /DNA_END=644 /DNA_ORIENTATION=-
MSHAFCAFLVVTIGVSNAAPDPVKQLDVTAYAGRWYQVYASASVKYTFQLGGNCVTADYGTVNDRADEVTVTNTVQVLGVPVKVNGYAIADPSTAGQFQVFLGPTADPKKPNSFSSSNYVVIMLGPLIDGLYDYAVVTDPSMKSLYVLTRNPSRFQKQYNDAVLKHLRELGFTGLINKPLKTNQEGCSYTQQKLLMV